MPEILTESFCERCGTRYTFESVAPKRKTRKLGQFKTLGKGVKNWVMSDDSSLDEAMAEARSDEERELTTQQLDAFHSTFNFCMSCRQYTCGNCWNTSEGRCLSCAPHLGHEILPSPFPDQQPLEPIRVEAEAWPEADLGNPAIAGIDGLGIEGLPANGVHADGNGLYAETNGTAHEDEIPEFDAAARLAFLSGETATPPAVEPAEVVEPAAVVEAAPAEPVADAEPVLAEAEPVVSEAPVVEVEPVAQADAPVEAALVIETAAIVETVAEVEPAIEAEPVAASAESPTTDPIVEERAAAGAARTTDLLARFRPGQNIDAELAAYEAQLADTDEDIAIAAPAGLTLEPEPEVAIDAAALAAEAAAVAAAGSVIAAHEPVEPVVEPIAVEPVVAAEPVAPEAVVAEPEPVVAAEPEPVVAVEPETPAAEPESLPIAAVAAGLAAEAVVDEPAAQEPVATEEPVAPPVAAEPVAHEPVVAAEPVAAPEPVAVPEPVEAPAAAAPPEPEPQPVAAEAAPAPVREDRIEQPTWQIFAPDQTVEGTPTPQPPAAPSQVPVQASGDPQWPVRPDMEESPSMALLANRDRASSDAMWAASAREVLATPTQGMTAPVAGVQPCSSCGLSLSANARFCRRCGTRQG
jgi:hypothetical protein